MPESFETAQNTGQDTDILILHVNYRENEPESYAGIGISDENGQILAFDSGNFAKDYKQALHFCSFRREKAFNSSSIDNYMSDLRKLVYAREGRFSRHLDQ